VIETVTQSESGSLIVLVVLSQLDEVMNFDLTIQCESKNPPCGFLTFFPNGWEFLINFNQSTPIISFFLDYKFLFNYFQL